MSKPEAYPFLRIARKHNVPYADVLQVADSLNRTRRADFRPNISAEIFLEIAIATEIQQAIRDGEINWLTGERV